jgi:hypothetical protein
MNFLSKLLSGSIQHSIQELFTVKQPISAHEDCKDSNSKVQNKINGFRVNNFSDDNKQIPENATDFQNLMEGHRGSKTMQRKSKKVLTTCHSCGHYRFAKRNLKRIINEKYPYEHSPKGGCPVPSEYHVKPGTKFRRHCICEHCKIASQHFKQTGNPKKKKNQYKYNRTPDQEKEWDNLKTLGWYCRKGKYYGPGMKFKDSGGLNADMVF